MLQGNQIKNIISQPVNFRKGKIIKETTLKNTTILRQ